MRQQGLVFLFWSVVHCRIRLHVGASLSGTADTSYYCALDFCDAEKATWVAFNNLYSGTVPANGICNRTPSANDNGTAATVMWSYAVSSSIAAGVATSPVLSLDGTKLAFVESKGGQQPHFHVLAWKSGDGVAANLQNTQLPKVLSTFTASAPVAGSGTATDLPFGASSAGPGDTLSSPFVDYTHDTAYVGDDKGKLVRIQDVFCVIDVFGIVVMNPDCIPAPPAPSIDTAWGGTGTVAVACAAKLTGPVVDFLTGNVFVGCADGKLYGFNSSGTALANSPVTVGDGTTFGGIVDPPIVDSTNGFVYAVAGSGPGSGTGSGGSHAVLVQTKTDLSSARTATLGKAGVANLHTGTFNDAYFSSSTSTDWLIYVQGYNGGGTQTFLYGVGFDASRNLNTGTPGNTLNIHSTTVECSPLTEFLNSGTDRLFLSLLGGANTLDDFNINSFPTTGASATAVETGGTSGIIVDNVSTANQASSIYFTTLGGHAAVKLSQSALE